MCDLTTSHVIITQTRMEDDTHDILDDTGRWVLLCHLAVSSPSKPTRIALVQIVVNIYCTPIRIYIIRIRIFYYCIVLIYDIFSYMKTRACTYTTMYNWLVVRYMPRCIKNKCCIPGERRRYPIKTPDPFDEIYAKIYASILSASSLFQEGRIQEIVRLAW